MEIGPIAGIRVLPAARVRPAGPELTLPLEVEAATCPQDDTYSPGERKASGTEDPEDDSVQMEDLSDNPETGVQSEEQAPHQINFFA